MRKDALMPVSPSRSSANTVAPVGLTQGRRARSRLDSTLAWVRRQLTTTPGKLALVSIAVVVGAVVCGAVAGTAEHARYRAANGVATDTEPQLVEAVNLYDSLSDADATAATTFLKGGLEPVARRQRYLEDLHVASTSLATLTRRVGSTSTKVRAALAAVTDQLPRYSGLVEAARANNRQGHPVGAAYLRQASDLLSGTVLPAAGQLYTLEATRLSDDYGAGTSTTALVAFILAVVVWAVLLLALQRYLARVTNRILNIPILGATALLAVMSIWGVAGLIGEQSALTSARRDGSDLVEVLSATRILASRAKGDESLALVARGGDQQHPADFNAVMGALSSPNGTGGLLGEVSNLARQTGTKEITTTLAAYRARHAQIVTLASSGKVSDAVDLAVGSEGAGTSPSDRLSLILGSQIAASQRRFERAANDATSALAGLSAAIPVLTVLIAGLALVGLRQRVNEYR